MAESAFLSAVRRRWYIAVFGLMLTAAMIVVAGVAVPATYQARAQVVLVPTPKGGSNPFLAIDGLQTVADVLARAMLDDATIQSIRNNGATGSYTVARDTSTAGPVLILTAQDKTGAGALSTMKAVLAGIDPVFTDLQTSVATSSAFLMQVKQISTSAKASTVRKSQTRAVVAATGLGILLSTVLVAAAERGGRSRQRRSEAPPAGRRRRPKLGDPGGAAEHDAELLPAEDLLVAASERSNGASSPSTADYPEGTTEHGADASTERAVVATTVRASPTSRTARRRRRG